MMLRTMARNISSDKQTMSAISLGALGVVFGDIGTSPLYAVRESLLGLPINLTDVLGVLSLIFWSLILIISIKYLVIVFQADNDGEGGILALLALIKRFDGKAYKIFFMIGIFGSGLMFGDGMITPAISVVSAVEGLQIIAPNLSGFVLLISCVILLLLFLFQSFGTQKIGYTFGPIILLWFCTIAILGVIQVHKNPAVLAAINPWYAIQFFHQNGWQGFILLGGVFLVVTGGEALYADLGHFGKNPIRLSWFLIALPSLLLNYFGQGAFLLSHPVAVVNPFYALAPEWFSFPLLFLATITTIIASQAVISAIFSLTKQAVLLGLYPHIPIIQTSEIKRGQIYIPQMNFILAVGTIALLIAFKSSTRLAHAYGIAVNLEMLLVTFMIIYAAYRVWKWSLIKTLLVFSIFFLIECCFLTANLQKILTGGWVPIVFAFFCAAVILTWVQGTEYLRAHYYGKKAPITNVIKKFNIEKMKPVKDFTAIFITDIYDQSGGGLFQYLKFNRVVPENILILNYIVENVPYVEPSDRFDHKVLDKNISQLTLHYGFMDFVNIPRALSLANRHEVLPFIIDVKSSVYLVEIANVTVSRKKRTLPFYWQEKLFEFLVRNYSTNLSIEFYHLPYDRTMAIGTYRVL